MKVLCFDRIETCLFSSPYQSGDRTARVRDTRHTADERTVLEGEVRSKYDD